MVFQIIHELQRLVIYFHRYHNSQKVGNTARCLTDTQNYPWIIGFSGGKDSTFVTHAVLEALLAIQKNPAEARYE